MVTATEVLLTSSLALAVPLAIRDLQRRGGPSDLDRQWADQFAIDLGEHGDALLYRVQGESTRMFAGFARALAILAYTPGGVTFAGQHWCMGTPDSNGDICRPDCWRVQATEKGGDHLS